MYRVRFWQVLLRFVSSLLSWIDPRVISGCRAQSKYIQYRCRHSSQRIPKDGLDPSQNWMTFIDSQTQPFSCVCIQHIWCKYTESKQLWLRGGWGMASASFSKYFCMDALRGNWIQRQKEGKANCFKSLPVAHESQKRWLSDSQGITFPDISGQFLHCGARWKRTLADSY